jgi:hypothetical protein
MEDVVDPFDHTYAFPPEANKVAEAPKHTAWGLPAEATGVGFTATFCVTVAEQPALLVTVRLTE